MTTFIICLLLYSYQSLHVVYISNPSRRCAAFTRARKATIADLTPEIFISPLTLLPCYAVSRMVATSHVSSGMFFLGFQTMFRPIIWRMANSRSSWSSRLLWCRHNMTTTAVQAFSHNCETVWCQMCININIVDISLVSWYCNSIA